MTNEVKNSEAMVKYYDNDETREQLFKGEPVKLHTVFVEEFFDGGANIIDNLTSDKLSFESKSKELYDGEEAFVDTGDEGATYVFWYANDTLQHRIEKN